MAAFTKEAYEKIIRQGRREIKNFKLKPAEQSLISLMQDAESKKKHYEDMMKEAQIGIDYLDKVKEGWNRELQERMGEKRYALYRSVEMHKAFMTLQGLMPVVFLVAFAAGIVQMLADTKKKEE